jgi:uncharacterized protein YcbX
MAKIQYHASGRTPCEAVHSRMNRDVKTCFPSPVLRNLLPIQVQQIRPVNLPSPTIHSIYCYPVKGLSAESRARTVLTAGETIPDDRAYAIENGPSGFDPAVPAHLPKSRFLMLMRSNRLGALQTRFDEATHVLTVYMNGSKAVSASLRAAEGRATIEDFIARHCADELRGPPKLRRARGHSFSDAPDKVVSLINLASVVALERAIGTMVNPLRFRGNIHIVGWPAWHEFDLVGREIALGASARLRITQRITRCAATEVDPDSGIRNIDIPKALLRAYGNIYFGVYGVVTAGSEIAVGDSIWVPATPSRL